MKYKIVEENSREKLEESVNKECEYGWVTAGGVQVVRSEADDDWESETLFYQALTVMVYEQGTVFKG